MEDESAKYEYTPLSSPNTIRVLEFSRQSYNPDSLIFDCKLQSIDLEDDNHPTYYALSYTWKLPIIEDESIPPRPSPLHIRCDGKTISIGENLFDCLYQLEHLPDADKEPNDVSYMWIDAVCINQEDLEERSGQVAMMQKIYAKAEGTLIWIGRQDRHSSLAIPLIKRLSEVADQYLPNAADSAIGDIVNMGQLNDEEFFKSVDIPRLSISDWKSISFFFYRSWFHRLWTVQEMVMGQLHGDPIVMCGDTTLNLEDLGVFITLAHSKGWINALRVLEYKRSGDLNAMKNLGVDISMAMGAIYNAREERSPNSMTPLFQYLFDYNDETSFLVAKFAWMLNMCRQKAATDERDRVFACSGMITKYVKPKHWHLLRPDYSKPVENVLLDASKFIIQSLGNLSLLYFVEDRSLRRHTRLPSWVPDFGIMGRPALLLTSGNHDVFRNHKFELNLTGPLMMTHEAFLNVKAFKLDELACTHYDLNNYFHNHKISQVLLAAANFPIYLTGETWLEAFMRTLAVGQPCEFEIDGTFPTWASLKEGFDDLLPSFLHLLKVEIAQEIWDWNSTHPDPARNWWEANAAFACLCDSNEGMPSREDFEATFAVFTTLYPAHQNPSENPFIEDEEFIEVLHNPKLPFVKRIALSYPFRAFVRLLNSLIGLVPLSAKPGDEIWIIAGSKVPFVLRQSTNDCYEVIGEAYIHGIMRGELFEQGDEHIFRYICLR